MDQKVREQFLDEIINSPIRWQDMSRGAAWLMKDTLLRAEGELSVAAVMVKGAAMENEAEVAAMLEQIGSEHSRGTMIIFLWALLKHFNENLG